MENLGGQGSRCFPYTISKNSRIHVLVPRKPLPSDIFSLGKEDYMSIVHAAQKVGKVLLDSLDARGIAIIFEGFEIDYAHVKLIPVLSSEKCTSGKSDYDKVRKNVFFESY